MIYDICTNTLKYSNKKPHRIVIKYCTITFYSSNRQSEGIFLWSYRNVLT